MLVTHAPNGVGEVFDPMSTTKCNVTAQYPIPNYDSAGDVLDGIPIICGGFTSSEYIRDCYKYDLSQNKWVFLTKMNRTRSSHAVVVTDGGRLWITGGWVNGDGDWLQSTEFLSADGSITPGPNLPTGRSQHCMVRLTDGRIMIIGGQTSNFRGEKKVTIYDLKSQSYTESVDTIFNRRQHACALFFSKMHNGRPVVAVIASMYGRSVELLDYTTPGAIWEQSKNISFN